MNIIKENISFIEENIIRKLYEDSSIDLRIADEISKAIYKQIPAAPVKQKWSASECPCCGCELSENLGDGFYADWTESIVCDCGQRLDWEE